MVGLGQLPGQEVAMLQIKIFGPNPPCARCKRAEEEARRAAESFPGEVEVVKLDAMGPEAAAYGMMITPLVVVGSVVAGRGKVVPAAELVTLVANQLRG
jgi:hypothetical protein